MNAGVQAVWQSWSAPVAVDLALLLAALVYARGWFRLRSAFPGLISLRRLAAFCSGIFIVWVAIGSPLNAFDDVSLTVHMLQHLLLMAVAPPLILRGAPALPLLHGLPRWLAQGLVGPVLRWAPVKRLGGLVTRPAIAWLVAALALIVWHIPAVFELALRWQWLHEFEHGCFFLAGLVFWWPVVEPWPSVVAAPRWIIPLYLFCATLPCDALSGFLVFCDRVVYSSYLSAPRVFRISPLQDQECAAALMWVCTTIIFLVPAVMITIQFLAPHSARLAAPALAKTPGSVGNRLEAAKWKVV
jgi:putative membrane protein